MKLKVLILFFLVFSFLITACSGNSDHSFSSFGDYTYDECVYVNPLSSSTIEYLKELHSGKTDVTIMNDSFSIVSPDSNSIDLDNPNYVSHEALFEIDMAFNPDISGILNDISFRYDVYVDGEYQGFSILQNETEIFIAKIEKSDGNHHIVWEIYRLV